MSNIITSIINGHTLRYLHIKNQKPILLFIPGNLQEIETLKKFNQGLSKHFDYYVLELPGTGHTEPLHPSYSIKYLSDILFTFVEKHIQTPFNLVTCSYGTAIGIEFAKTYNRSLNNLVLAGSMKEIPLEEWPTILGLMADCLREPDKFASDFMELLTAKNVHIPKQKTIITATKRKASRYTSQQFWCFIFNSIRLMSYKPEDNDLTKIKCPTLCFTGEHDPYVTKDRCLELAKKLPNASYSTIPNTDHLFHIEDPEATINLIVDYLSKQLKIEAA